MASPRLAAVRAAASNGDAAAVDRLFDDLGHGGTPLVEEIPGDADNVFVTFLWRSRQAESVAVVGGPGGISHNPLVRLEGTDLWYRTHKIPSDSRFGYQILENPPVIPEDPDQIMPVMMGAFARMVPDATNPNKFVIPKGDLNPIPVDLVWSVVELKDAPPQKWIDPRPEISAGHVETFRFESKISNNERRLWVYTPPDYDPTRGPYPWLCALDGAGMMSAMKLPVTLDNLISEGRIPPMAAIMIEHPGGMPGRVQELACSEIFTRVVCEETTPWLAERCAISPDPARAIVAGGSFGGLGATFIASSRPDIFGNVLSNSGSYWWASKGEEPEWLARRIASGEAAAPTRCYLDVGRFETGSSFPGVPDLLTTVRHMRNVLTARGSQVFYAEHNGGHDLICMKGNLAEGLIALAGDWTTA